MSTSTNTPAVPTESPLPSPAERPDADVVIYDGHCRICSKGIRTLARMDRGGKLAFLSLHDPQVAARYPDLSHDALMQDMYLVDRLGRRHRGAAAFRELSRKLPRLWPLVPLLHIPFSLPLWQWCYRRIANARYRFGRVDACSEGTCSIHFRK